MKEGQRTNGNGGVAGRCGPGGTARATGEFVFLSQIMHRAVLTPSGRRLGRVREIIARAGEIYPAVEALVVGARREQPAERVQVPWKAVATIGRRCIGLSTEGPFPAPATERTSGEIYLAADILDHQIVDTLGAKVVRVNDLHFLRAGPEMRLVHVDVGLRGLVRRLGLQRGIDRFVRTVRPRAHYLGTERFVSWKYVQPLATDPAQLHLNIPQRQLAELHPADIADIMEELDAHGREALFAHLDVETAAEALEEADPKVQRELIEGVAPERAADIVEEMNPDNAADLLRDLPSEHAQEILREMEREEAEDVRELLAYDEDTAGGLMTTEFITIGADRTVAEALDQVRREAEVTELIYYLYVTDGGGALRGVVSLRELIVSRPSQTMAEIMSDRPVTVHPDADLEQIASTAAKYNLLAVPVVDDKQRLLGTVTVDDVLDRVMHES